MYLLDSDVFIQAKNLHYGFDFCPAFWDWLDANRKAGLVASIEQVRDELLAGEDDLAEWARRQDQSFYRQLDDTVVPSLRAVSQWANAAGREPAAVNIFLQAADYYLIAHAHVAGDIVVTHEKPSPSLKKIKIPDACIGLGVKYVTPFQMLRAERAKFVIKS